MTQIEQPSVEALVERVRLAFNDWIATDDPVAVQDALAALDSLTAALRRAERERDHWIVETKKADRRAEAVVEAARVFTGPQYHQGSLAALKRALTAYDEPDAS